MKFSIITVNYNNCEGIRQTIESVISQTFIDYEFIIIDGGSTDGSVDVIKKYQQHISYWISEKDNGVYNAMNKGILVSHGDILNFMNSGDRFYDSKVLEWVSNQSDDYDILVGKDYHFNKETRQGFASILPPRLSMITFYQETLPHQGAFFKRHLFDSMQYDETFKICADWAFYIQKIVKEESKVVLAQHIISNREQGGLSSNGIENVRLERKKELSRLLLPGIKNDYETITKLDRSTVYKLFLACEHKRARKWLTLAIKIISRLYKLN